MPNVTIDQVTGFIRRHATQSDLIEILDAVEQANKKIMRQNFNALERGSRVKFVEGGIRPMYLRGKRATVVEIRQTRVTVELDCGPIGKFRNGRVVSHPNSLEILEATA